MNNEKSVTKRENAGALATNVFEADADAGSQNISQEDLALPFLKVLGQLSPEVNKKHGKYPLMDDRRPSRIHVYRQYR